MYLQHAQMPVLDYMGDQFDFENEDVKETMNNSKGNETIEEDNAKVRVIKGFFVKFTPEIFPI